MPAVIAFKWPLPVRQVFYNGRHYAVICTPDGALWVADTGCGYHLVPEADVSRGSSVVVDNPGARKLHTANGEVRADECVKFSLQELGLTKNACYDFAPDTSSLEHRCLVHRQSLYVHWPAGGTPFFTMLDGKVIWCEVYGKVS